MHDTESAAARLEYLRGELRAERISQGELCELESLAQYIDPGDVELLEAAGVPEFPEGAFAEYLQDCQGSLDLEAADYAGDPDLSEVLAALVVELVDRAPFWADAERLTGELLNWSINIAEDGAEPVTVF